MMAIGTEVFVQHCDILCVVNYSENDDMTGIYSAWGEGRVIEISGKRRSIVYMKDGRIYITPVSMITIHKRMAAADRTTIFDRHKS